MPIAIPVASVSPVVTLAELKNNLKIDYDDDDGTLELIRSSAIDYCEKVLNTKLSTPVLVFDRLDRLTGNIELKVNPVNSIDSVTYYDTDFILQTVSSDYYHLITSRSVPAQISLKPGYNWPANINNAKGSVIVNYYAGYTELEDIPPSAKYAVLALATHWYINRETVTVGTLTKSIEFGINAMLHSNKVY